MNQTQDETGIQAEGKDGIHMMVPLGIEMSSTGIFLMNGVDIRFTLDLCPSNILINAADETSYKYMKQTAKLWTQKIVPNPDALFNLNKSLINIISTIEYAFERPIMKNYLVPTGQNSLSFDNSC